MLFCVIKSPCLHKVFSIIEKTSILLLVTITQTIHVLIFKIFWIFSLTLKPISCFPSHTATCPLHYMAHISEKLKAVSLGLYIPTSSHPDSGIVHIVLFLHTLCDICLIFQLASWFTWSKAMPSTVTWCRQNLSHRILLNCTCLARLSYSYHSIYRTLRLRGISGA